MTETVRVRDPPDPPPPLREDDENPLEKELELDWNLEDDSPDFSSELDGLEEVWKVNPEEYRPDPDSSELPDLEAPADPKN